jgi:uncharacterized protein DUF3152
MIRRVDLLWEASAVTERHRSNTATMVRDDSAVHDRDVADAHHAYRHYAPGVPPRPGRLRRFVRQYGWRAYALPLLAIITVVAVTTMDQPPTPSQPTAGAGPASSSVVAPTSAPATVPSDSTLKSDQPGPTAQREVLASDALPAGAPYTQQGKGTFRVIPGSGPVVGSGTVHRYTIDVEDGVTGISSTSFAATVQAALNDGRGWTGHHSGVAWQRVDRGPAEFHVTLTSSLTVRALCGYELKIETSCYAPTHEQRVVLNVARWVRGDMAYVGDVATYRDYMVNHETGHALGHSHEHSCLKDGLAPLMMQQTIGLTATNGKTCQANPWPYPAGATDAPGAEQPGS